MIRSQCSAVGVSKFRKSIHFGKGKITPRYNIEYACMDDWDEYVPGAF
jgi:hypothetical protein